MSTFYAPTSELYHYGRLGMKWGQHIYGKEDYSASKTTKLKSGQKLYRVTATKDEETSGTKYVTFTKSDRDLYRSEPGKWIAEQANVSYKDLVEKTYELRSDVKIPTDKHIAEVYNDVVLKNPKFRIAAAKASAEMQGYANGNDPFIKTYSDVPKMFSKAYDGDKFSMKEIKSWALEDDYNLYKRVVDAQSKIDIGKTGVDVALPVISYGFGSDTGRPVRDAVIDRLKKQGYNAMTDYAGIGVGEEREGRQPLILFDVEDYLTEIKTVRLKEKDFKKATKRYMRWRNQVVGERVGSK